MPSAERTFRSNVEGILPMEPSKLSKILIGTTNQGKIRELNELLASPRIEFIGLNDVAAKVDVEETGKTFAENAALKALAYARRSGLCTLADDSGLEVRGLNGRPGILSARYAGDGTSYAEKIRMLLEEVTALSKPDRSAQFVCVMSLAAPSGEILFEAKGICKGTLAKEPRGTGGFGYDPIFMPDGYRLTFGELDRNIKQQISHRARAAQKIIRYLQGFFAV